MGCAVTKKARCIRQQKAEERKLNQYWYDREEHLITVHEPSSIVDSSDLRTDLLHTLTKDQEILLRGITAREHSGSSSGSSSPATGSPRQKMPRKAAKVLLDPESIRRDSGIEVESSTGDEEEEEEEMEEASRMLNAHSQGQSLSQKKKLIPTNNTSQKYFILGSGKVDE